jgi:predicted MFS family arabinose efflux permease
LTFFSLVGAALTWFYLPAVERQTQAGLRWQAMWAVARRPNVLAAMGVGALLFVAIGMTFTVWSIWLSTDFTLEATALGLVATGLGVAELVGSGASSLFIDRLGKRRGCLLGLLLMALAYGLLPLTRGELWLAIAGLLLVSVFLEFSIVSLLSLYSEQVPEARATVFSLVALGGSIGLALGSPAATLLWENASLWGVCLVAGAAVLLAWSLTWRFLEAPS